ncbi:MAG: hypothetical protein NVSMB29_01820 [Candidatus Dormibacteria bacterium]
MRPVTGEGEAVAAEIGTLSYERALEELDGLITRLEAGRVDLDEAISCYERGARLAQHCERLLDRTEQKVTQVVVTGAGEREQPFDPLPPPAADSAQPAPRPAGPEEAARPRARSVGAPLPFATPGLEPRSKGSAIDPDDIPF